MKVVIVYKCGSLLPWESFFVIERGPLEEGVLKKRKSVRTRFGKI